VEIVHAVQGLSGALGLNFAADGQTRPQQLNSCLNALNVNSDDEAAWDRLTDTLYDWESQMQDALALRPWSSRWVSARPGARRHVLVTSPDGE